MEHNIQMLQDMMIASSWQKLKSTVLPIQDEILEMRLGFAAGHLCTRSVQTHV